MARRTSSALVLVLLLALAGCASPASPPPKPTDVPKAAESKPTAPVAPTTAPAAAQPAAKPTEAPKPAAPKPTEAAKPAVAAEQPKTGGTLRVGIQNFDPPLNPVDSRTGFTQHVWLAAFEKLVNLDAKANVVPGLATQWQVAEGGKSITLTLQKGVKFHDGTEFNAEAAKFNIDRARDSVRSRWAGLFETIQSVDVVDPSTVRVNLREADASLLTNFAHHGLFIVAPSGVTTAADGKEDFKPIGTGPFKITGTPTADRVSMIKNTDYRQPEKVYLDKIEFFKITDATVRLAGLRSGDLDIIDAPPPQEVAAIKQDRNLGYIEKPGVIGYIVRFMESKPPFDNPNLRRAVAYTIDRDAINKVALFGTGAMHQNFMYPEHWAFDPSFKGLPLDLEKAREALRQGQQPNGFNFAMTVANREPELSMAQAMKAQLAKVGIDMEIVSEDSTRSFDNFKAGMYAARLSGGSRGADPITDIWEWHSKSPDNYYGYKNEQVDRLMDTVRTEFDVKKRAEAMHQLNPIFFVEDPIGVMFGDAVDFKAWNAKVRGVGPAYGYPLQVANLWLADTPRPGPVGGAP
jgi:peptide/nickel transport system substrate-binding protein